MHQHAGRTRRPDGEIWKGMLAGVIGGLVASWTMTRFQAALTKASADEPQQQSGGDDATMKTAEALSESVLERRLTRREKQAAGPIVHYAFGSAMGAVYGVLAEVAPRSAAAWGAPFGTALWFGADEVAVPALGLSKSPSDHPASAHASALAAHLVYGVTTDLVRRAVRAAL